MSELGTGEITRLLELAHEGEHEALDRVMALVYADLERAARGQLTRRYGRPEGRTLEPAGLVNEAFLRLVKQRKRYDSRGHFFAIATKMMFRVLIDHERSRTRDKRGGDPLRVSLTGLRRPGGQVPSVAILDLAGCLDELEDLDRRAAEIAKLHLLWGLTIEEIAGVVGASRSTVEREWRFARKWLAMRLTAGPS
jgi:RNA polymerase sigma factor (TIGR02999 family)